jgi:hypothetical protein
MIDHLIDVLAALTPLELQLELRRKISVKKAAELNNLSEDTFRKNHRHLIRQVSKQRQAVELGDALSVGKIEV